MRRAGVSLAGFALALLLLSPLQAQRKRDALTAPEIDQLRDTAMEPDLRLKLYVTFARARLVSLEQARSDPENHRPWPSLPTIGCRTSSTSMTN